MRTIIGRSGSYDLCLSTGKGNIIPNRTWTRFGDAQCRRDTARFQQMLPRAQLRSARGNHNCMGLAFAARRTAIDIDHLPTILQEDGYRPLGDAEVPREGDLVAYRNEDGYSHVGLVWTPGEHDEMLVLSKWGALAEFLHPLREVPPAYGSEVEFWTDREEVQ